MMSKIEALEPAESRLSFIPRMRKEVKEHADWNGKQNDSRSGLGAYYRYKPRNLALLCEDEENGICIKCPKIHHSVFQRIRGNVVPYVPTGLPDHYEVATNEVGPLEIPPTNDEHEIEDNETKKARANAMNRALDVIYWRRKLYFTLMVATLGLFLSRYLLDWEPDGVCLDSACLIDPLLGGAQWFLPDLAGGWFEALKQNPLALYGFIFVFVVLFILTVLLLGATESRASAAWAGLRGYGAWDAGNRTLTSKLRKFSESDQRRLFSRAAAFLVFVLLIALAFVLLERVSLHARSTLGMLCDGTKNPAVVEESTSTELFSIGNPCFATRMKLEAGKTYEFRVEALLPSGENQALLAPDEKRDPEKPWKDGVNESTPDGIQGTAFMMLFAPLRRHAFENYLKLVGRINETGNEEFVVGSGPTSYRARSTGELFLYANDVAFGFLPGWDKAYKWEGGRNTGSAIVTVTCTSCEQSRQPAPVRK